MADILILDDAEPFRRMLSVFLRNEGHDVTDSGDGVISYDRSVLSKIDLMITDIDMPRVNGIEAILAALKIAPDLKIIAISGGGMDDADDYLSACTELGAAEILQKPFEPDTLLRTVRNLLAA